jgi:predicted nucleic acid-binding protein
MRIILDTNILLSALIRDSATRYLIVSLGASFYFPEQAFDEILRNKEEILLKGKLEENDFNAIILTLFKYITILKSSETEPYLGKADGIIGHIHKNDVVFVAAALAKNAMIWSNDAHFKEQNQIPVITSKDMVKNHKKLMQEFGK